MRALADLAEALRPADPRHLVVLLDGTLRLWRKPGDIESTAEFYVEALEEFPVHVIEAALRHVRLSHRYPTMPSPADFRAAALSAIAPLWASKARAELAAHRFKVAERLAEKRKTAPERSTIPYQAPRPKKLARDRGDGRAGPIDLGDVDARMAEWERRAAQLETTEAGKVPA